MPSQKFNPSQPQAKLAKFIGERLRDLRVAARLTQKELAAHCEERGVKLTRGTVAKIEIGARLIKACELFVIAKAIGVPIESFYPPDFGNRVG